MFKINDYIVYGNYGVCKVEKIGTLDSSVALSDRIYYTLCPYDTKGSFIFTPVDNEKVSMRPVITKEEAMELIDGIEDIESLLISDDRGRELEYKKALQKSNCRELIRIIKTIDIRKQTKKSEGKKVGTGDEKYFRIAEDTLYGELAVVLGMKKDQVRDYIFAGVS